MKYRRFRLRKPAPVNSERWRCNWLRCAHGLGLAGMGQCSARGEWWNKGCPKFETYGELEMAIELEWLKRGAILPGPYQYPGGKASEGGV